METSILTNHIEFLYSLLPSIVKGVEYYSGVLCNGFLLILRCDGLFYTIDVSTLFPSYVFLEFNRKEKEPLVIYADQKTSISEKVFQVQNKILSIERENLLVYHEPDLRTNPQFEDMIGSKTAEGSSKLYITTKENHDTFMILYKGLFNLNKPDTIELKVCKVPYEENVLLSTFLIHKKKQKLDIKLQFIFIDMNQRRRI